MRPRNAVKRIAGTAAAVSPPCIPELHPPLDARFPRVYVLAQSTTTGTTMRAAAIAIVCLFALAACGEDAVPSADVGAEEISEQRDYEPTIRELWEEAQRDADACCEVWVDQAIYCRTGTFSGACFDVHCHEYPVAEVNPGRIDQLYRGAYIAWDCDAAPPYMDGGAHASCGAYNEALYLRQDDFGIALWADRAAPPTCQVEQFDDAMAWDR